MLFDLGDIASLSPRKIQRLGHVFVSHAHIDHFVGFDRLLRVLLGRDKLIHLYGPNGFVDHVHHKLRAYLWNLVGSMPGDLTFVVTEIDSALATRTARFRLKAAFAAEAIRTGRTDEGVLVKDPAFRVSTAVLEHHTPCLGFAIEEPAHINIWKNRLAKLRLPVGPWLRDLKRAVIENRSDDFSIQISSSMPSSNGRDMPLAKLRDVLTITPGQNIGYVTDVADTADNRKAIVNLVRNADLLFIEAAFAKADVALATERAHLTTEAPGKSLARRACGGLNRFTSPPVMPGSTSECRMRSWRPSPGNHRRIRDAGGDGCRRCRRLVAARRSRCGVATHSEGRRGQGR
jgi:ribonuclease Z